jgi:hypothetical protein
MKSNILINCLVLFYNVGIFPSDLLTFFILIDLHAYSEVFATEPYILYFSYSASIFQKFISFSRHYADKFHAEVMELQCYSLPGFF